MGHATFPARVPPRRISPLNTALKRSEPSPGRSRAQNERDHRMVSRNFSVLFFGMAVALLVAACAGPVTQAGGLPGTWHGAFLHPGADYTSPSRSDLTLQVNTDSTYTLKWGSRAETTGSIADQGNRVVLTDSSGAQITLMRSGDALYGVVKDATTGR